LQRRSDPHTHTLAPSLPAGLQYNAQDDEAYKAYKAYQSALKLLTPETATRLLRLQLINEMSVLLYDVFKQHSMALVLLNSTFNEVQLEMQRDRELLSMSMSSSLAHRERHTRDLLDMDVIHKLQQMRDQVPSCCSTTGPTL
jgi:hypothetical protein